MDALKIIEAELTNNQSFIALIVRFLLNSFSLVLIVRYYITPKQNETTTFLPFYWLAYSFF